MVRMHCNAEVIRLRGTATHVRAYCEVCEKTFEQRKRVCTGAKGTLPFIANTKVLIDLKTGESVQL